MFCRQTASTAGHSERNALYAARSWRGGDSARSFASDALREAISALTCATLACLLLVGPRVAAISAAASCEQIASAALAKLPPALELPVLDPPLVELELLLDPQAASATADASATATPPVPRRRRTKPQRTSAISLPLSVTNPACPTNRKALARSPAPSMSRRLPDAAAPARPAASERSVASAPPRTAPRRATPESAPPGLPGAMC